MAQTQGVSVVTTKYSGTDVDVSTGQKVLLVKMLQGFVQLTIWVVTQKYITMLAATTVIAQLHWLSHLVMSTHIKGEAQGTIVDLVVNHWEEEH